MNCLGCQRPLRRWQKKNGLWHIGCYISYERGFYKHEELMKLVLANHNLPTIEELQRFPFPQVRDNI